MYDTDTLAENDICSVDSVYYASTLCDSSVHDLELSPLSAYISLINLGLRENYVTISSE